MSIAYLGRLSLVSLICATLVSQSAFASIASPIANPSPEAFNLQTWNQTAEALKPNFNFVVRPSTLAKADPKEIEAKYKSTNMGQAGRVLLLITALAGVELVRRQVREAHLSGKHLSAKEYSKLAAQAALKVADSGDVWFGIASDLGIGAATKKPAAVLNAILKDKVARPILIDLVQNGIMSLIYFVGFQACAQLWRDARLMLDPKDYERSEHIWSLGVKGMIDMARSKDNSDDARITRQMFSNIVQILILNEQLRENWFYNTWRLGLATGRFVTLVTGLVTATTIGTAICPGAGTVLGFIFALTGAVVAASLPPTVNESISQKIKAGRIAMRKFQGGRFNWRLKNLIDSYSNYSLFWHFQASQGEVDYLFKELKKIREHVATAYIEKIYIANTNIQRLKHDLEVAKLNKTKPELVFNVNSDLHNYLVLQLKLLRELVSYYDGQDHMLGRIVPTTRTPKAMSLELEKTKAEVSAVKSFLTVFGEALMKSDQYPSSEIVLQNYYLRAFFEDGIDRLVSLQTATH